MARRRLSRQQTQRIRAQQERRRRRADRTDDGSVQEQGTLGPEQHGLIITHHGTMLTIEGDHGARVRCTARQNLGPLACGDQVVWQRIDEERGVVVALQPRRSLLARPDTSGRQRPLAANVDRIFVVNAAHPPPSEYLIDRYLVTAELTGIEPALVVNKIDLAGTAGLDELRARFSIYARIGYSVLYTSATTEHGLDALTEALAVHTSVLVGQSGVGKSSLVKALLPEQAVRIGDLSDAQLGRHTTTTSVLYHLPGGGNLIDSPGVRDFAVWHLEPQQIAGGFREFAPFLGRCRFSDCSHRQEPECALREAVRAGDIASRRLESYLQIMDETQQRSPG